MSLRAAGSLVCVKKMVQKAERKRQEVRSEREVPRDLGATVLGYGFYFL